MNYEPDDPRLTAYALNELDEATTREIEAHLQEDAEARRMVEDIRATSALLCTELKKESAPKLHAAQRAAIQTVARVGERKAPRKPTPLRQYRPFVAAAAALLLVSVTMFWTTRSESKKQISQLDSMGYSTTKNTRSEDYRERSSAEDKEKSEVQLKALDGILHKAELGDHFETINLDKRDTEATFANPGGFRFSDTENGKSMEPPREQQRLKAPSSPTEADWRSREQERAARAAELSEFGEKKKTPESPVIAKTPIPISSPNPVQPLNDVGASAKSSAETSLPVVVFAGKVEETTRPAVRPSKEISPPATQAADEVGGGSVGGLSVNHVFSDKKTPAAPANAPVTKHKESNVYKKELPTGQKRPVDHGLQEVDAYIASKPEPLNPLGYAEPRKIKPTEKLRYDIPQYRSYIPPVYNLPQSSEEYARVNDNTFRDTSVLENRLSTFSADVDTASYTNVRRFINQGQLPPADAVRIEEMVNYFKYDYTAPSDGKPFHVFMELAQCPWNPNHKLARVGIKAAEIDKNQRPASNLVFLIDVSGSMDNVKKLPLVKKGLTALVENLNENDRVAIVTYANGTTLALASLPCNQKGVIIRAIEKLKAEGGTNGGDGIQRAYEQAANNFIRGGVNRVILATDGDFNVGITDQEQLTLLIESKANEGVFLTVLGYGMGNLKDAKLELLADKGNGNYAYIDNEAESQRVLIEQMSGTLVTVAKDVKLQVEFNPSRVRAHRLVGYENRILAHAAFNDDTKDAGEIGAGHIVTALYEIVPTRGSVALPGTDPLRYLPADAEVAAQSEELMMLKIRYKLHNQDTSNLLEFPIVDTATSYAKASSDFKFSAAVAGFGMLLRGSPYRGNSTFESILELGNECVNGVPERKEFIELVQKARELRR